MTARIPSGVPMVSAFPASARRLLLSVGLGWVLVGAVEAVAYTGLALAIVNRGGPQGVLALAAASLVITVLCSRAGYLAGARLAGGLYRALGTALSRTKLAWFTPEHRALVTHAAGVGIPSLMGVPAHQLQTLILAPIVPLLLVVGIAVVSGPAPASTAAALLAAALSAQVLAQRRLARADAARHKADRRATAATLELVDHLELLQTVAGPVGAAARTEEHWLIQEAAMRRTNRAAAPATLVAGLASALPLGGILLFLAATGGFADPFAALALIVLVGRASAPLDELALAGIAVSELQATTAGYRDVVTAPTLSVPDTSAALRPRDNRIELRSVAMPPAIESITATISERSRTHIAGPSGSGKSTLLGLLLRFDDPAFGEIVLGGVPLKALTEEELASRVAYVPQDPVVFTGTIASNIRIGRPDATDEQVVAAAQQAGLGAVLVRDPSGAYQSVGRRGAALSGGERQRLAIARALIKDASVIVLDEATSALDETTERLVVAAVTGADATIVFVTHRSPDIWTPDQSIVLGEDRG